MKNKSKLTLLGIWNILPIGAWNWHNDEAINHFKKITGRRLRTFFYVEKELNYEYFLKTDTDRLFTDLKKLSPRHQTLYVKKIVNDYYRQANCLEKILKNLQELSIIKFDNQELAKQIKLISSTWSKMTMQIWYAVLLDIWFPSSHDKKLLKKIIAPARDHCGHFHVLSDKLENKLYRLAAKRIAISEKDIRYLVQPEIIDALLKSKIKPQIIRARKKLCLFSAQSGRVKIYTGKYARQHINNFQSPGLGEKQKKLVGIPACLGKVKGKARVILLDSEFAKFKKGEILVSIQTMVHFLPIMRQAKAIVTEFGGLTSHAAIVSRELKKPCIVGVKGLIKSIKTGDLITVDADKGIIEFS